jgi:hypothetical protein
MMVESTVPDFFQEETADALRAQADWLAQAVGVEDAFFAKLLGVDEKTFTDWRYGKGALPPGGEDTLRQLWRTMLHVLSFLNFDLARVRELFQHTLPGPRDGEGSGMTPPWSGASLKAYLEGGGADAIEKLGVWVTGLRFGDPWMA